MNNEFAIPRYGCRHLCADLTPRMGSGFVCMSAIVRDRVGMRFGTLTVIRLLPKKSGEVHRYWECSCSACGKLKVMASENLNHKLRSCGCLRRSLLGRASITHGATIGRKETREYKSWLSAKARCKSKTNMNYGGRGIKMCHRWWLSFIAFKADMGPCPEGCTIDRINPDGDYEPGNCRWATIHTQSNNKRNVKQYTHNGRTLTLPQWSREIGVKLDALRARMFLLGWSLQKTLDTPSLKNY